MGLIDSLPAGPVAIDTQIVIYFIQRHPDFVDVVRPLFEAADQGSVELVTSALTLLEVLVVPYREGDMSLAARYEALLTGSRGLTLVEVGTQVLRGAAYLRAVHGTRTPDAVQLASALARGCGAFVTNDHHLRSLPNLRVVQLRDFV